MTIRPICITGDPVLHTKARVVTEFGDELSQLVMDMYETMEAAPGVGLAAPQIGVPLRIFVFDWNDGEKHWRGVAINPELQISAIDDIEPDEEAEVEGCLSIPGERAPLRRAERATLVATDLDGSTYQIEATGWLARIFQHEFDHLEGTLYRDRLLPHYRAEIDEVIRELEWGQPGLSWLPGRDDLEG